MELFNAASFGTSILKWANRRKWFTRLLINLSMIVLSILPVVTRASPPVGWHNTMLQPGHKTTVWAWLKTVVILTQPLIRREELIIQCLKTNRLIITRLFHTWAFHIHEEWVRTLNKSLKFAFSLLLLEWGVQQVFCELQS